MGLEWNDPRKPQKKNSDLPAQIVIILMIALVIPPYIWLARLLWEWALG